MKILSYRICYLISLLIATGYDIYCIVMGFIGYTPEIQGITTIMLIAYLMGLTVLVMELYFVITSFKKGTALLCNICFTSTNKINKIVLSIALGTLVLSLFTTIFFGLNLLGLNPIVPDGLYDLDLRLIILVFGSISINALFVIIYTFLFRKDLFSKELI